MSPALPRPKSTTDLRERYLQLRQSQQGKHALDFATQLSVAEVELLASTCSTPGAVVAHRLRGDARTWLPELPKLGKVKTVTRNANAVIEVVGSYDNVEFFGSMGQSVGEVDLRVFASRWSHGFYVKEDTRRGPSESLQFFDDAGTAIHKVFVKDHTDRLSFDAFVTAHLSQDQSNHVTLTVPPQLQAERPDSEVDVAGLRTAWNGLKDTHDFFMILRRFGVTRTQALRVAGSELAYQVSPASLATILEGAASADLSIMVFVGNNGIIQIYSGPVRKVVRMGAWINVLDPSFDLHVREDAIHAAWVVRKPTVDGVVTSLELYTEGGEQIAQLFGKRKPGQVENDVWRALVEGLPQEKDNGGSRSTIATEMATQ